MDTHTIKILNQVAELLSTAKRTLLFTGAGVSTESGIPDFRGPQGLWKKVDPKLFTFQNYVSDPEIRKQSWKMRFGNKIWQAAPNPTHIAIAELEKMGICPIVVTQNIDGLHQKAGSTDVIELHGTLRETECLSCGARDKIERTLARVDAGDEDPACFSCSGILKVATISFGQNLRAEVLDRAFAEAARADLCFAIGSTLSVTPAAYIPLEVTQKGGYLIILNAEPTEMDGIATHIIQGKSGTLLPELVKKVRKKIPH